MRKPDPVQQAVERISNLRHAGNPAAEAGEISSALRDKHNLVVAKAAEIGAELHLTAVVPDLLHALERLLDNPAKLDKGCAALTAIIGALHELDYLEPEPYLRTIGHVQLEGSFGPPIDVAAKLRGRSALGLVRTRLPDALLRILPLLTDPEPQARVGAARAFGAVGGETAALVLRLKVLTGDDEPEIIAECFSGLLSDNFGEALPFAAGYLDDGDESVVEAAILALAATRQTAAIEVLKDKWERTVSQTLRRALLLAFSTSRSEQAAEFLVSLLASMSGDSFKDVLSALAAYRNNERIRSAAEEVLERRGDRQLLASFREMF